MGLGVDLARLVEQLTRTDQPSAIFMKKGQDISSIFNARNPRDLHELGSVFSVEFDWTRDDGVLVGREG